ncbi:MAG: hypothetical protein RSG56_04960, partial [Brevundimonas sp.]
TLLSIVSTLGFIVSWAYGVIQLKLFFGAKQSGESRTAFVLKFLGSGLACLALGGISFVAMLRATQPEMLAFG